MGRLIVGSLVAALAMFAVAFLFYATPLSEIAFTRADPGVIARVQAAVGELPMSGTYAVPDPTAPDMAARYAAGPVATIKLHKGGFPAFDPLVLLAGYAQMAATIFVFGLALWAIRARVPRFAERAAVVGWAALGATAFNLLGDPIWYRHDWGNALYVFTANAIVLTVGGLMLARWFVPRGMA